MNRSIPVSRLALFSCFGAVGLAVLSLASPAFAAESNVLERIRADQQAIQTYRAGLEQVVRFAASRPDLFPTNRLTELRMLTRENKDAIWTAWKTYLDYSLALDSIRRSYATCLLIPDAETRAASFLTAYSAFLAQYRFALEFLRLSENDSYMHVLLDDAVQEMGIPAGTYTRFKFTFLNAARATEWLAYKTVWSTTLNKPAGAEGLLTADASALPKLGVREGLALTADNALDLLKKGGSDAWFPVQKGVSIWMGDTKVWRKNVCLITGAQIEEAATRLEPGDVLLERREWYMSNVGLPGFWPHAVLFVGTAESRRKFFDDPGVRKWVQAQGQADGDFENLLAAKYPDAIAASRQPAEDGHVPRILEAIGEGVLFTTLEHSAAADSLCALRPRLTKQQRAVALFRALQYVGRPYDYNFDFMTDSAVVCTELIYKSYQPCPDSTGLDFPMVNILGRLATPANELVRQFDETFGTPRQQYDLVLFLDGKEKEGKAAPGTLDEFRKSWRRPKWHVVAPEQGSDARASDRPARWAQPLVRPGLPNLHKVTDALYRGAQPEKEGFAELEALGIKTVVNLRAFHSDRDNLKNTRLAGEEISFKTWHPEEEDVLQFLRICSNTNNAPIFVHCQHGADRTGTMCAIYRIAFCGWTKEEAIQEMTRGGFGFHGVWQNLVEYLDKLDVQALRRKLDAAPARP